MDTQVHTPAWGKSRGVIQNQENDVLLVLLCIFRVVWSHQFASQYPLLLTHPGVLYSLWMKTKLLSVFLFLDF